MLAVVHHPFLEACELDDKLNIVSAANTVTDRPSIF